MIYIHRLIARFNEASGTAADCLKLLQEKDRLESKVWYSMMYSS